MGSCVYERAMPPQRYDQHIEGAAAKTRQFTKEELVVLNHPVKASLLTTYNVWQPLAWENDATDISISNYWTNGTILTLFDGERDQPHII